MSKTVPIDLDLAKWAFGSLALSCTNRGDKRKLGKLQQLIRDAEQAPVAAPSLFAKEADGAGQ